MTEPSGLTRPAPFLAEFASYPAALRVLLLCSLVVFVDGFDTQLIASLASLLAKSVKTDVAAFGPVFSVGLLGMMIGSILFGVAADRFGRKRMIIASVILFTAFTLCTVLVSTLNQLLLVRFLTGLGMGGALPNVLALSAEYAPPRSRSLMMNLMYCGYPLGGIAVGVISSALIDTMDWQDIYLIGGLTPLVLIVALIFLLPESREVRVRPDPAGVLVKSQPDPSPVSRLFTSGQAPMTLVLWTAMFMSLLVIMFMVSWLTAVLARSGIPVNRAVLFPSIFSLGGIVGSILMGFLMDRNHPLRALAFAFLAGGGALALFAVVSISDFWLLGLITCLAGLLIIGGQTGLQAFAATVYPPEARATGVGCAIGVGRVGSIVGPLVGGSMLRSGWAANNVFAAIAIPAVLAATAVAALASFHGRTRKIVV